MTTTTITVGRGEFSFCAAHTGLHAGGFEPLHGHTFEVSVQLHGAPDPAGMVTDFGPVKAALRRVIAPLRRRTLVAADMAGVAVQVSPEQVSFADGGGKRYVLPAADVALLPVVNTTTEVLAGYLLEQLRPALADAGGVVVAELTLAEAPDVSATVRWVRR